jgi:DNA-binding MarR family transcriptional regulator
MNIREELHIGRPLDSGHEVALALLLTREYVSRLFEEQVFKGSGITDQQYNLLRILKGGPEEGYLIKEIRCRMIYRFTDVPRLVDRLVGMGLALKAPCPKDRRGSRVRISPDGLALEAELRPRHAALCRTFERGLSPAERQTLLGLLERMRDDYRAALKPANREDDGEGETCPDPSHREGRPPRRRAKSPS